MSGKPGQGQFAKIATIAFAVTIIGLVFTPIFALFWGAFNFMADTQRRRALAWFQRLAAQEGAALADIGVYFGGHPLLPQPGKCALYLRDAHLSIMHDSGTTAAIPLTSIQFAQAISDPANFSIGTVHEIGGVYLGFFHQPVKSYLQINFSDDKGYTNVITVGGTYHLAPGQWSNYITTARYQAT